MKILECQLQSPKIPSLSHDRQAYRVLRLRNCFASRSSFFRSGLQPAHLFPQLRNVGHVMPPVPRIQGQVLFQRHGPQLRMIEDALPVLRSRANATGAPSDCAANRATTAILPAGWTAHPPSFAQRSSMYGLMVGASSVSASLKRMNAFMWLSGTWCDDLTHGPSAVAVGSFDLLRRKPLDRGAQGRRSLFDVVDQFLTLLLVRWTVVR